MGPLMTIVESLNSILLKHIQLINSIFSLLLTFPRLKCDTLSEMRKHTWIFTSCKLFPVQLLTVVTSATFKLNA